MKVAIGQALLKHLLGILFVSLARIAEMRIDYNWQVDLRRNEIYRGVCSFSRTRLRRYES